MFNYFTHLTSFKQIGSSIENTQNKNITFIVWPTQFKSFVFLYQRSNLFETRQMGKVVQHCENILSPLPELLRGVATHQTQIVTPISNWPQRRQLRSGAVILKHIFKVWKPKRKLILYYGKVKETYFTLVKKTNIL